LAVLALNETLHSSPQNHWPKPIRSGCFHTGCARSGRWLEGAVSNNAGRTDLPEPDTARRQILLIRVPDWLSPMNR
jgi:hypothetical protein